MNAVRKLPPIEVLPRDLSAWEKGNTGTAFVHRFDSGRPGPRVMVVGLTHGNEFCGAEALHWALGEKLRPLAGSLVLAFANVAAYRSFEKAKPLDSRFLDRDLNRVWRDDWLANEKTREADRARELLPFVTEAEFLLDIHSTSFAVRPFFVSAQHARGRDLAQRIGAPRSLLLVDGGFDGRAMIEHGEFADPQGQRTALVVECGAHFLKPSVDVAKATMLDFLATVGSVDPDWAAVRRPSVPVSESGVYEITEVYVARSDDIAFLQPFVGFEEVGEGTPIVRDGDNEVRAPYPRCTVLFPKAQPMKGRELVTLARRID
ncbi:MAG: succinylglutamate desuccinylase/aspartoacylase family protein [Rhodospirillales bacterium]|nr:succinylglutamate desuccinylase/aspartoacylase family protein [Rhodospirillales bacterium]